MNFNGRLIGLHGAAGSGKDTAADILVRLGWVKIALADPMKRAVKEWFGFTDESLWGPSWRRNAPDKRNPRRGDRWVYPVAPVGAMWLPLADGTGFHLIDVADYESVVRHTWRRNKKEDGKKTDYVRTRYDGRHVSLHVFLMSPSNGNVVDHINGDGLDNRRKNLRVCTPQQNRYNQDKRKEGGSPFKGVGWLEDRKKWRAYIREGKAQKTIGYFDTEEEAAVAYDAAAVRVFGEYARLNAERFLTPRHALQQLGTEYGRACYEDVWVDYALRVAGLLLRDGEPFPFAYDPREGARTSEGSPARGVVISDVRFPNEAAAIDAAGGRVIQLTGRGGLAGDAAAHASESGIPSGLIDVVIDNSGTLEALTMAVERLVM